MPIRAARKSQWPTTSVVSSPARDTKSGEQIKNKRQNGEAEVLDRHRPVERMWEKNTETSAVWQTNAAQERDNCRSRISQVKQNGQECRVTHPSAGKQPNREDEFRNRCEHSQRQQAPAGKQLPLRQHFGEMPVIQKFADCSQQENATNPPSDQACARSHQRYRSGAVH